MDNEEIIRMAREAGFTELDLSQGRADILKDFAALVAANIPRNMNDYDLIFAEGCVYGKMVEREACAKVVEEYGKYHQTVEDVAAAIRARSEK